MEVKTTGLLRHKNRCFNMKLAARATKSCYKRERNKSFPAVLLEQRLYKSDSSGENVIKQREILICCIEKAV